MTAIIDPLHIQHFTPRRSPSVSRSVTTLGSRRVAPPSRSARPSAAVYRRRRMAVGSLVAVVAASLIGITMGSSAIADQSRTGNYEAPRAVVVQQGDTLWAIARRIAPSGNIANLVNELVRLNGADLQVGQVVRIP